MILPILKNLLIGWLFISLFADPAFASIKTGLTRCGHHKTVSVLSGDSLQLQDGSTISLSDIKAPEFWPVDSPYKSWPYGRTAKLALTDLLRNQEISLWCTKNTITPFGNIKAHIFLHGNLWLQEWLVENGHAYFFPSTATQTFTHRLLSAENMARRKRLGLWKITGLDFISATGEGLKPGWFQLVTGKIVSAKHIGKTIYLNFDTDWRTDFTVQMNTITGKKLVPAGRELSSLEGREIEVKGWVEWSGGPKVIISHPEQIQFLPFSKSR